MNRVVILVAKKALKKDIGLILSLSLYFQTSEKEKAENMMGEEPTAKAKWVHCRVIAHLSISLCFI